MPAKKKSSPAKPAKSPKPAMPITALKHTDKRANVPTEDGRRSMATIEQIARAALDGEGLTLRALTQDFLRGRPRLSECPRPQTADLRLLAACASLIELFAARLEQPPPAWAAAVAPLTEPVFLVRAALHMKRLRQLCETESPAPLRKRGFLAPPNFLEFA